MLKETAQGFQVVSVWIIVLPFLAGITNYKGLNSDAKRIFLLVLIALVPQLLTGLLHEKDPLIYISYNLYTPLEFGILYSLFISKFTVGISRRIVQVSCALFMAACVVCFVKFGITTFLNGLVSGANILYMFWTLLLLKQEYDAELTFIEKRQPFTWFLLGIVLYACGRVGTMALYHYIRSPQKSLLEALTLIDSLFNILLYLFFSVGLLIRQNTLKTL